MAPRPLVGATRAITCREVVECTTTYLEHYVRDAVRVSVESHLASCAGCRAYVDQIASVREALKVLPGPVMRSAQRDRLRRAFAGRKFD
jgi:predicted anti-sigma-YlaC factor YlaD